MTKTVDFDAPLTEGDLDQLYREGKLPRAGMQHLLQLIAPRNLWGQWADKLSLVVGVILLLAGIVFFFAFNWREMPGWQKLGLINLGLVTCLVAALVRGLDSVAGQALAIGASLFVGVFMAVFGQIYQTGADAYQLFMMWVILILPWAVLSKSLAHWTLWLVIAHIFMVAIWVQTVGDGFEIDVPLAIVGLLAFGVQSFHAQKHPKSWTAHKWFSWIWLFYSLTLTAFLVGAWIFKLRYGLNIYSDPFDGRLQDIAGLIGIALHALGYYFAFRLLRNLVSAQIWTLISSILTSAIFLILFAEWIFDWGDGGLLFGGLFMAAVVAGIFWGGIKFLNLHEFVGIPAKENENA